MRTDRINESGVIGMFERKPSNENIEAARKRRYGEGNIDLLFRPKYTNRDGSISTVRSMSFQDESGKEILIPTIVNRNGKAVLLSDKDAIDHYYETGQYLGKFDSVREANAYAQKLHKQQEKLYGGK